MSLFAPSVLFRKPRIKEQMHDKNVLFVLNGEPVSTAEECDDSYLPLFSLGTILSKGSFGSLYSLRFPHDDCIVKIVPRKDRRRPSKQDWQVARYECEILHKLAALSSGEQDAHFLTLPLHVWLNGGVAHMVFRRRPLDLCEYLKTQQGARIASIKRARHILQQTCIALRFMHQTARLVHNDVKPENILIDPHDKCRCWLTDFGAAGPPSDRFLYYNRVHTLFYASPERQFSFPYDERSDSWSLGVVAVDLVVGLQTLHDAFHRPSQWAALLTWQRPFLNERMRAVVAPSHISLPTAYYSLLDATLQIDPNRRLSPAQLLRKLLKRKVV